MRAYGPAKVDVGLLLERLGIKAEKKSASWWACCPFHNDKKPSWRMRDEPGHVKHGKHTCFSCGEGGSHIYLVQRVLELATPREAWLWVNSSASRDEATPGRVVLDVADRPKQFQLPPGVIIERPLDSWPTNLQTYARSRGLTAMQIERWGIGYAVDGRLRKRIVIPVRDWMGRLTSYTARAWIRNVDRKYLEPREDEGADKSAIFGEQRWPRDPEMRRVVVVSEGALNALAIERAAPSVSLAALMGSHFTPTHAVKLSSFPDIVLAADPDKAGDKLRALVQSISRWSRLHQLRYPDGMDACDLDRDRPGELLELVSNACRDASRA